MTLDHILRTVTGHYSVDMDQMRMPSRLPEIVLPRQVYCYLASKHTSRSLSEIGRMIWRDHTTVHHAINRVQASSPPDLEQVEAALFEDFTSIPFKSRRAA